MNTEKRSYFSSLIVLILLFFMWGFITSLNDILTPHLKEVFHLSHFEANFVMFAFFSAYFIGSIIYFFTSLIFGDPIFKFGYKRTIVFALILSAIGCTLFYPAAEFKSFTFFLTALAFISFGLTILQIAANPYVALLGKPETASSRLNLTQGFNSFGTTIGPVLGGFFIFKFFGSLGAESVKIPYLFLAGLCLLLTIFIAFAHLPALTGSEKIEKKPVALKHSNLFFGMFAIFFYVGAEVTVGSNLISYMTLPDIGGFSKEIASRYLAFFWGGAMIGRFLGFLSLSEMKPVKKNLSMAGVMAVLFIVIFLISRLDFTDVWFYLIFMAVNYAGFIIGKSNPHKTLTLFVILAMILALTGIFVSGKLAMWSVLSLGLFNSIMWANIFTLAIDGLGEYTSQGSSLLVMMILGGAIVPLAQGALADATNMHLSLFAPLISYLYLLFYGLKGYKKKIWGKEKI